ncbi:MAG: carbohydrate binding domain-containing protein, partial [Glaciecola sp.]
FSSGVLIENNLFNNVGNHHSSFSAININGGGQNEMKRNAFKNSARPIKYNKFAELNLFNNYKNSLLTAQAAFNSVGVANTDYDKYADFKIFLNYDSTVADLPDFKHQRSDAVGNVSYNDQTVAYDSAVHVDLQTNLLTGVILPAHDQWEQSANIALDSLTTDLSALWSNIEAALDLSSGWASSLTSVVANLNTTLADIYTVGENGGTWPITNLVSNGDFENGTSPWSAMKRQGQWTSLQTELHNNSLALRIGNRVNPGHSAKYALSTVSANQTFNVTADLNTTGKITVIYRYKDTSGSNRTITVGWQDSDSQWISYNQTFTLPGDADPSQGIELWFKTGNSANQSGLTDIFVDNLILQ